MERNEFKNNWGVKTGDPTDNSKPADFEVKLPDNKENLEIIPLELALIDEKIPEILKKYGLEASDADISSIKKEIDVNSESIVDGIYEGIEENLGENKNKIDLLDFQKEPIQGVIDHLVDKVILYAMTAIIGMIHEDERTPVQIANLNKIEKIIAGWEKGEEGGDAPPEKELNIEEVIRRNVRNELNLLTDKIRTYAECVKSGEIINRGFREEDFKALDQELALLGEDKNIAGYEKGVIQVLRFRLDRDIDAISVASAEIVESAFLAHKQTRKMLWSMEYDKSGSEPKPPTESKEEKRPKNKFETALNESIKSVNRCMKRALEYIEKLNDPQKEALITNESIRGRFDLIMKRLQHELTQDQTKELERLSDFSEYDIEELRTRIEKDEEYIHLAEMLKKEKAKEKSNPEIIRSLYREIGNKLRSFFDHEVREKFRNNTFVGEYARALIALEFYIRRGDIKIVEKGAGGEIPTGEDLSIPNAKEEETSSPEEMKITPDQREYLEYTHEIIDEYIREAINIVKEKEGRAVSLEDLRGHLVSFLEKLWRASEEKIYESTFRPEDLERIAGYIIQGRMQEIIEKK